ncbi:hypothetical protein LXA43DRAFT_1064951 [Ganoderma leucocontextum]|nr:hypothetical protein LXA43DRAFT_1064951 [Ganoderma leucocontextum]
MTTESTVPEPWKDMWAAHEERRGLSVRMTGATTGFEAANLAHLLGYADMLPKFALLLCCTGPGAHSAAVGTLLLLRDGARNGDGTVERGLRAEDAAEGISRAGWVSGIRKNPKCEL